VLKLAQRKPQPPRQTAQGNADKVLALGYDPAEIELIAKTTWTNYSVL
jgi:hypothetical protein